MRPHRVDLRLRLARLLERARGAPGHQPSTQPDEAAEENTTLTTEPGILRHALQRFGAVLQKTVSRASKSDEKALLRTLEEWNFDELVKRTYNSKAYPEKTDYEALGRDLRVVLGPFRKVQTHLVLRVLQRAQKSLSSKDITTLLNIHLWSLEGGKFIPGLPASQQPRTETNAPEALPVTEGLEAQPEVPLRFFHSTPEGPDGGRSLAEALTESGGAGNKVVTNEAGNDNVDSEASNGQLNIAQLEPESVRTLQATETGLEPVFVEDIQVPSLSFDLSRVLFNPGVYQLQDPRSRVYNFDPYLEKIMPVTEFDFEALNEYVTSSEDDKLRQLAMQSSNRYIGSSSSMTSTLSQFHFLISAWRDLSFANMTKGFKGDSSAFTRLTRSPSAVFLRWRDGVYAMDADKEYDSANILMSLGKSIEKLLTLEKDDFERYRKSARGDMNPEAEKPEQYHYGQIGKFLMRSQLDAYDPRLPGTGMFDLKTRAVAAVRFSLSDHERALGYQIKNRFGTWESYEREYFDMIRSAFLKYSLQVRMGRMDGIFVAFHNIERIFGFQYIPLSEMDEALHGQTDPTVGDGEFGLSVKMMEDIFDRATARFPEQTLRIYVETREPTPKMEPVAYMNVFAEAVTEEEVEKIQQASKAEIEAFEQRIFNGLDPRADATGQDAETETNVDEDPIDTEESETSADDRAISPSTRTLRSHDPAANDADVDFLDSLSNLDLPATDNNVRDTKAQGESESPSVVGFKVVVRNTVNGREVPRVQGLKQTDDWRLEYTIDEIPAAQAVTKYRMCKARRTKALLHAMSRGDEPDYFLAKLLRMSETGREWRQKQDELDAQRQTVVLYDAGRSPVAGDASNVQQQGSGIE